MVCGDDIDSSSIVLQRLFASERVSMQLTARGVENVGNGRDYQHAPLTKSSDGHRIVLSITPLTGSCGMCALVGLGAYVEEYRGTFWHSHERWKSCNEVGTFTERLQSWLVPIGLSFILISEVWWWFPCRYGCGQMQGMPRTSA
ncbi:hypothetical protein BDN71DRAFT_315013 [Pleurotus eryngii]|uniref:Uncharacterized protein n=1 Tax=Pleurotus eryngii TaxID=5323 RepID=A0A9P6A2W9_PLEER|nr:hypothetical protein BDN71DRAFT_315013 [Pleurotus eryngii]